MWCYKLQDRHISVKQLCPSHLSLCVCAWMLACVCVWCARMCFAVMFESALMSTNELAVCFKLITVLVSTYTMCVLLCLVSALSGRIGTLSIFIIIIIWWDKLAQTQRFKETLTLSPATSISTRVSCPCASWEQQARKWRTINSYKTASWPWKKLRRGQRIKNTPQSAVF